MKPDVNVNIQALLLLLLYLFAATPVRELCKLPRLAEHYTDYQAESRANGFIGFLFIHYIIEDGNDADAAEDRELPFKSPQQPPADAFLATTPPGRAEIPKPVLQPEIRHAAFYNPFIPAQFIAGIWQPPRNC